MSCWDWLAFAVYLFQREVDWMNRYFTTPLPDEWARVLRPRRMSWARKERKLTTKRRAARRFSSIQRGGK